LELLRWLRRRCTGDPGGGGVPKRALLLWCDFRRNFTQCSQRIFASAMVVWSSATHVPSPRSFSLFSLPLKRVFAEPVNVEELV
jgi:hypothetical protein